MTYTRLIPALAGIFSLMLVSACGSLQSNESKAGAAVGGVAGAAVGSQIGGGSGRVIATVVGAIAGGVVGAKLGERMAEDDRKHIAEALATNQAVSWTNDKTGDAYRVEPGESFTADGRFCRDYVLISWIDGERERTHGSACRGDNGEWRTRA